MDSSCAANCQQHFYPRSPCGERPRERASIKPIFGISIHALLAESDQTQDRQTYYQYQFLSTLSLRRATIIQKITVLTVAFLSTLSLRRATISEAPSSAPYAISIHALLAESDVVLVVPGGCWLPISIHALLAESDSGYGQYCIRARISIHALLAESDNNLLTSVVSSTDFYPRSPCGERP